MAATSTVRSPWSEPETRRRRSATRPTGAPPRSAAASLTTGVVGRRQGREPGDQGRGSAQSAWPAGGPGASGGRGRRRRCARRRPRRRSWIRRARTAPSASLGGDVGASRGPEPRGRGPGSCRRAARRARSPPRLVIPALPPSAPRASAPRARAQRHRDNDRERTAAEHDRVRDGEREHRERPEVDRRCPAAARPSGDCRGA